jgi:hypothetical protein
MACSTKFETVARTLAASAEVEGTCGLLHNTSKRRFGVFQLLLRSIRLSSMVHHHLHRVISASFLLGFQVHICAAQVAIDLVHAIAFLHELGNSLGAGEVHLRGSLRLVSSESYLVCLTQTPCQHHVTETAYVHLIVV